MKVITATVKFPAGKVFEGKFGGRQNVKFVTERGDDANIWFNEGDRRYIDLQQGEIVQLLQEGEKFTLIVDDEPEDEPTTPQATPAALASVPAPLAESSISPIKGLITTDEATRAAIYREMCKRAQVMKSCHVQVVSLFTNQETGECILDAETIQKYATTLYLDLKKYW
jgi:hypothetical protein